MNDEDIKKKIIEYIQKEAISQEFQVTKKIIEFKFSEEEIKDFIKNEFSEKLDDQFKIQDIMSDLKETRSEYTTRYFYELTNSEGESKQRELDLITNYTIADTENILFFVTILGDIKRTNKYKWVFSTDVVFDEVDTGKFDFPMLSFNLPHTIFFLSPNSIILLHNKEHLPMIPITNHLMSFYPNGDIVTDDSKYISRSFFEQIISGVNNFFWERKTYMPDTYENKIVIHIIIPLIVTSSNYYYCKELPPSEINHLLETDTVIYLFSPSNPSIINQWRIPIIVTSENALDETIKKIILYFKADYWKYLYKHTKD